MCLTVGKKAVPHVAKKDIVVYKALVEKFWYSNDMEGKQFTAIINGCPVKGKICVERDNMYLCTNSKYADGASGWNKHGYKYSWYVDSNVQKLVINDGTIVRPFNILVTPYRYAIVETGMISL